MNTSIQLFLSVSLILTSSQVFADYKSLQQEFINLVKLGEKNLTIANQNQAQANAEARKKLKAQNMKETRAALNVAAPLIAKELAGAIGSVEMQNGEIAISNVDYLEPLEPQIIIRGSTGGICRIFVEQTGTHISLMNSNELTYRALTGCRTNAGIPIKGVNRYDIVTQGSNVLIQTKEGL